MLTFGWVVSQPLAKILNKLTVFYFVLLFCFQASFRCSHSGQLTYSTILSKKCQVIFAHFFKFFCKYFLTQIGSIYKDSPEAFGTEICRNLAQKCLVLLQKWHFCQKPCNLAPLWRAQNLPSKRAGQSFLWNFFRNYPFLIRSMLLDERKVAPKSGARFLLGILIRSFPFLVRSMHVDERKLGKELVLPCLRGCDRSYGKPKLLLPPCWTRSHP